MSAYILLIAALLIQSAICIKSTINDKRVQAKIQKKIMD